MAEVVADLERCLANRSGAAQTLAEQSGISDPRLQEALCFLQETAPAAPTGTAIHTEQASPAGRQTLGSPALSSQTTGAGREAASGELPAAVGRKKAILLAAGGGAGLLVIACVVILAVIPHNAGPDARTPKGVVTQGGPQVRTGGAGTPSVAPRPAADAASSPVPAAGKARVVTASADHTAPTPVSAVTGSPVQAPPPVAKPPIAVAHAAVAMIPPSVPSKATSVAAVVELQSRTKPVPASAATGPSKQTSPTPINSQSPTPGSSSLLPVPAESVREAANKLAQDVYRSEYDGAKTSTARRSLAKRILDDARKSQGSATERYVLLRLARDVALAGQDENVALEAIDELSRTFAINAWGMRVEAMQQLVKGPHPTAARREFSQRALALAEEALKADRIAAAGDLAQLASSEAGKARDREVALCARNVAKEVEEAMKTYTVVEAAQGLLKADPDDPAANLAVGKYLCFVKDDWDQGLSRLAKGADNKLKALAESELSALADLRSSAARRSQSASSTPNPEYPANVPLTLADGWWDLGQSAAGKSRQGMLLRAAYWYQQVGDVASALARNKVERRLAEIAKLGGGMAEASRPRILVNSLGMKVALIRAGEFEMGSSAEDIAWATRQVGTTRRDYDLWSLLFQSEGPRHRVRISKPFYLGVYEVTQAEYQHVMGVNPSEYSSGGAHKARVVGQDTARHPVERVSWNQAMEFCRRLSTMPQESSAHREYTLPTEAQWEYACRAGTTSRWHCGDDQTTLSEYAWIKDNAGLATHPVGQKEPNAWGLHDMLGNGREWCLDWYAVDFYQSSQPVDPTGPTTGEMRVHRGGCFLSGAAYCRSAARGKCLPQKTEEGLGFRVACWVGQKTR
jgi:formylglycine-generating enzyme required for sulfatase activity